MKISQIVLVCLMLTAITISCGGCGDDPVEPADPPRIAEFTALPNDIMPGDSTLLSYRVIGADSLKLYPDNVRLSPTTTGELYVNPSIPTVYGLIGYNKSGKDSASVSITMSGAVASIAIFDVTPDRILIGDSLTLTWRTERADSVVISENQIRILNSTLDSGQVVRSPNSNTTYTAVAYNDIGNDTNTVWRGVEVPFAVDAVFGTLFKGTMGSGIQDPPFRFRVLDASSQALRLPWLFFSILEGDGYLIADSAQPDANGAIWNDYIFDGQLGHAVIRAMVPDIDTLDVRVRASVLRLGTGAQGQYIRFDDTYADVLALNGQPDRIDVDTSYYRNFAVYENSLGVVIPVEDLNGNEQIDPDEPILEVYVNTIFTPRTPENIGIGTSIQDLRGAYGPPDSVFVDPIPPSAEVLKYVSLGALFYCVHVPPDSAIIEIHLWEPIPAGTAPAEVQFKTSSTPVETNILRHYRR